MGAVASGVAWIGSNGAGGDGGVGVGSAGGVEVVTLFLLVMRPYSVCLLYTSDAADE